MKRKYFSTFNLHLSTSHGFTLIELLIVIAILGVLAASLLAFIDPFEQLARTRDAGRKTAVNQLGNALRARYIATGGTAWPVTTSPTTWITVNLVSTGELKSLPTDSDITPGCNTSTMQLNYCYKRSATSGGEAIVYTLAESTSEKSKCTTSETAYILWTSVEGGKTGVYCSTAEPAATTTAFNLK